MWFGNFAVSKILKWLRRKFCSGVVTDYTKFYFRNAKKTFTKHTVIQLPSNPKFNKSYETICYIHGFLSSTKSNSSNRIMEAYMQRKEFNVIAVDWESGALPSYFNNAVPNTNLVGVQVAEIFLKLIEKGLDINKVHLVGHSLGAHMAGVIGRYIKKQSNNKYCIRRISALDPALPGFYGDSQEHLSEGDADFVAVTHTDAGFFGASTSTGTVDFWPNGGFAPQPFCQENPVFFHACSHIKSSELWEESVLCADQPLKFNAVKAENWEDFKMHEVGKFDPKIVMGPECPINIHGDYFFQTNGTPPFRKGLSGIVYVEDSKIYSKPPTTFPDQIAKEFDNGRDLRNYFKSLEKQKQFTRKQGRVKNAHVDKNDVTTSNPTNR